MRIEINSGGLQGNAMVDEMKADVSEMITSSMRLENVFGQLSQSIYGVTGGVGNLQTALNDIDARRRTEEQRGQTLRSASDAVERFINNTRNIDTQVAGEIGGHQVEDYDKNGWNNAQSTVSGIGGEWAQKGLEYAAQAAAKAKAEKPENATHAIKAQTTPNGEAKSSLKKLTRTLDEKQKRCDAKYTAAISTLNKKSKSLLGQVNNQVKNAKKNELIKMRGGYSPPNAEGVELKVNKIIYEKCFSNLKSADFGKVKNINDLIDQCMSFDKINEDFYVDGEKYHLNVNKTGAFGSAVVMGELTDSHGHSWSLMQTKVNPKLYVQSMQSAERYALEMASGAYKDMLTELAGWSPSLGFMASDMGATDFQQKIADKFDKLLGDEVLGVLTDPDHRLGSSLEDEILGVKDNLNDIRDCYGNLQKTSEFSAKCFASILNDKELAKQIFGTEYGGFLGLEEKVNFNSDWMGKVESMLSSADADTCKKIQDALDWTNKRIDELGGPNGVAEAWDKAHESSWFNWIGTSVANELALIYGK